MTKKYHSVLKYDNIIVPIDIYKEMRMDVRVSIVKDKAIIRVPLFYTKKQMDKNHEWAKEWILNHLKNNKKTRDRFIVKRYFSGDELKINEKTFILEINLTTNKNYSAILDRNIIKISVPSAVKDDLEKQNAIKTLQSRVVAQYFQNEIAKRITDINRRFFGFQINNIRLKYNKTNWGSRSAKSNINISTRLLFAPKDVQDYVFIHELAHFKEMNHSPKFWKIVREIMPDYKEKEKWLKANGHNCDF